MPPADSNPQAGQGKLLPKKEADIFKNVVKHYEVKQYKKAVKQADSILKKFPNHGETLAMKGLTLNCMNKRDEAHALVKQGLMNDLRSHVCWHVLGLLHRSDRNYTEAIKAYKQALRIDQENLQILRDLSLLQIQMRDLSGFLVTRHTLLTLKPNAKMNWLSFALAKHLNGDLDGAIKVIDIYLSTLTEGSPELERGFESSELALYRNSILAEIPDNFTAALDHLDTCENVVVDRGAWLLAKARHQLQLGQFEDARKTFMSIFERGATDEYCVHSGYMCALLEMNPSMCDEALSMSGIDTIATTTNLSSEQRKKLLEHYQGDLSSRMPRSQAIQRIPLTLLEGDEFREAIDKYCRKRLSKGVPSLGTDLSALLLAETDGRFRRVTDPVDVQSHPKFELFVTLADEYVSNLSTASKFAASDEKEEPQSTLLWAWYFRAVLHELAGEFNEGTALANKCLEHTQDEVDVYELKARLLKAAGDIQSAVECLDKGREMDQNDRYINNQTTKYMLQAGMDEKALERISLFTKHEGNPEQNLFDMQCSWYELELAECLARKQLWGRSLKKFGAVVKHFDDFHEDQFDFHSYCIRKVTLRAYTGVLRWEDELWCQEYYGRAAEGIIRIYLHLYDNPSVTAEEKEPDYSKMTAAERKRAKAIARKRKKAAEKAAEKKAAEEREKREKEAAEAAKENGNNKKKKAVVVDQDPNGEELLKRPPLDEAKKYSAVLSKYAPNRISTWILQYDVAIRRGKTLMALQALARASALDPDNHDLFSRLVDFSLTKSATTGDNEMVKEVLNSILPGLMQGKSTNDFVLAAKEKIAGDKVTALPLRVAVAKALIRTETGTRDDAAKIIVDDGIKIRSVSVDTCREALVALRGLGEDVAASCEKWMGLVKTRFPMAKIE